MLGLRWQCLPYLHVTMPQAGEPHWQAGVLQHLQAGLSIPREAGVTHPSSSPGEAQPPRTPPAPSSLLNLPAPTPSSPCSLPGQPACTRPWTQSVGAPQNPPGSSARQRECTRPCMRPKHCTSHILCLVAPRCLGHFSQQQQTPRKQRLFMGTGNLEKRQILEGCLGTHDNLSLMARDTLAQQTKTFWFGGTGF